MKQLFLLGLVSFFGFQLNAYDAFDRRDIVIDEIFRVLGSGDGRDYYGESISQLEHALQCAQLARDAGSRDVVIAAALLHDIGHLCPTDAAQSMNGCGVMHHETVGACYIAQLGFDEEVQCLVAGHVAAKRYLVSKNPEYAQNLSEASKETLAFQGGLMSAAEIEHFESLDLGKDILNIRFWDEQAKVIGLQVAPLEEYREILKRCIYLEWNPRDPQC